jgi:hypothetical protein
MNIILLLLLAELAFMYGSSIIAYPMIHSLSQNGIDQVGQYSAVIGVGVTVAMCFKDALMLWGACLWNEIDQVLGSD